MKELLKRALRRVLAPITRRAGRLLEARLRESEDRLLARIERNSPPGMTSAAVPELLTHLGQRLRQLAEETRGLGVRLDALEEEIRALRRQDAARRDTTP